MEGRVIEARPKTVKPGRTVRGRLQHPDADLQPKRDKDKRGETKNEHPQALCLRFRLARPAEEKRRRQSILL
jgi:hypothetical protein